MGSFGNKESDIMKMLEAEENEVTPLEDNYVQSDRPNDLMSRFLADAVGQQEEESMIQQSLDQEVVPQDIQQEIGAQENATQNFAPKRSVETELPTTKSAESSADQVSMLDTQNDIETPPSTEEKTPELSELQKAIQGQESAAKWGPIIEGITKMLQANAQSQSGVAGAVGQEVDLSFIQEAAKQKVKNVKLLEQEQKLKAMGDPNSEESIAARAQYSDILGKALPDSVSATQIEKTFGQRMNKMMAEKAISSKERIAADKISASQRLASIKASAKLGGPGASPIAQKIEKLSGENKKRLDNIRMGLKALEDMSDAIGRDVNTFKIIGDNDYTMNRDLFTEALGRMQSGGAIQKDELKKFMDMAPKITDSSSIQKKKLKNMYDELSGRLKNYGINNKEMREFYEIKEPSKKANKILNPIKVSEVRRRTKDGRTAIFDSNSKKFIRYE